MLQMKFKPRFIEAFRSGQKTTSLRQMKFDCFPSEYPDTEDGEHRYFHKDTMNKDITIPDYSTGESMILDAGTPYTRVSKLSGLLKRQPYQPSSNITLVTEIEGGEIAPFAFAFIAEIAVIREDQINNTHAIMDGFNPDSDPLAELLAFMQSVYPRNPKEPPRDMYWLYTFTNVQMLPQWGGAA
ncbi:hypothetical protein MXG19_002536 [Salmonella enterica]|nr:hypothetical protein [Salmonella enterica]EJB8931040.1 hypothetical protein [Salmonella enterica]EJC0362301.1 hypothetical protein [Salmonella enterica]EJK5693433.1 hypothetical protein [Salmonella enterica]